MILAVHSRQEANAVAWTTCAGIVQVHHPLVLVQLVSVMDWQTTR